MSIVPRVMPVTETYRHYRSGNLLVNRKYQRKLIWSVDEKEKLIGSILKEYPIPLILLAERPQVHQSASAPPEAYPPPHAGASSQQQRMHKIPPQNPGSRGGERLTYLLACSGRSPAGTSTTANKSELPQKFKIPNPKLPKPSTIDLVSKKK
jgi:hypothetical protein